MIPLPPPARATRGVTLIELLVVLAVMGVLIGLGVSMFTNMGRQGVYTVSISKVLQTLSLVRNSSMSHPAALQINAGDPGGVPPPGVWGIEFVTMFQSQCEPPVPPATDEIQGARDRNGKLPGGAVFKQGVLGQAVFLEGGGFIDCGDHAAYQATEGVSIDLWIFPTSLAGGILVRRGEALALSTVKKGEGLGVRLDLNFEVTAGGAGAAAGESKSTFGDSQHFETPEAVLPMNRWSRVVATYDCTAVTILVDSGRGPVERFRQAERSRLLPAKDANLTLGGGTGSSFRGGIDDVRIEGVLAGTWDPLPPQVLVEPKEGTKNKVRDWRIRFVGGRLDPAFHTQPEAITIAYGARRRRILIGLEGNVIENKDLTESYFEDKGKPPR